MPKSPTLLTRDAFRETVTERDGNVCVVDGNTATAVHHIIERRLFDDGGYYEDNGVCLCDDCHVLAEKTLISCEALREKAGIKTVVLPNHLDENTRYDKWGNAWINKDIRARGELFFEEPVQKIIRSAGLLDSFATRVKYPKTLHLPFSPGLQNDDRLLHSYAGLEGEEVIASIKLDGENASIARHYSHARSVDSANHPSRNWLKALHARIKHEIPEDFVICGENCFAEHSLHYDHLPSYFFVFNMWERGRRLAWDDTVAYCDMLGLEHVPVLWRGTWDADAIKELCESLDPETQEGLVVQVTRSISASEWQRTSTKFVRKGHVQENDTLWMLKPVVPNGLASSPEEVSFLGRAPEKQQHSQGGGARI